MQSRSRNVLTAIILIVILALSTFPAHAEVEIIQQRAGSPYDLVDAVNAVRVSYGLAPYNMSSILMSTAQSHADYMAASGRVSHAGSGGSTVTDRLLAAGYPLAGDLSLGGFRSENITSGLEGMSAQAAVDQWTGDTLHLTTMISPNLTEIGAGVSVNGGRVYYVIDCALPTDLGIPQDAGTPIAGRTAAPEEGGVFIPVEVSTPNADGDLIHEVKAGQTLWQIAISYGTQIDEIKRLNNLFDNDIYPGTKLLIKKGVSLSPTAALELATVPATVTSAILLTETEARVVSATTITPIQSSVVSTASNRSITRYVIGIVALAILGGALFMWLGNVKQD